MTKSIIPTLKRYIANFYRESSYSKTKGNSTVFVGNICKYNPITFVGNTESLSELHAFYMVPSGAH